MTFLLDMKRMRTIEKDFMLKPNPYITQQQSNKVLWKLAVGQLIALSSVVFLGFTLLKIKPSITSAPSFRNVTYFGGFCSLGLLFYHLHELDELAKQYIPQQELKQKMSTYDRRYE